MDFTGRVGSKNSQLGSIQFGYDPMDEVVVTWMGMTTLDDSVTEMEFSADEGGHSVKMILGIPAVLTRDQVVQARRDGAVLIVFGNV